MKSIITLASVIILFFASCGHVAEPIANFDVSSSQVMIYDDVEFFNNSTHATHYEWDFGDGYISSDPNPVHYYTKSGIYEVRLSAFYKNMVSYSYYTITVERSGVLNIEVREYFKDYLVPNASIIIYPSLFDWDKQTNQITEVIADRNGIAEVTLTPGVYYLDIWEKNHDNIALGLEDPKYIRVYLENNTITYFTAYVDYIQPTLKKSTTSRRNAQVSVMKNRVQKEVKVRIEKK